MGGVCLPVLDSITSKLPGGGKLQRAPAAVTPLTPISCARVLWRAVRCHYLLRHMGKESESHPTYRIEKVGGVAFAY